MVVLKNLSSKLEPQFLKKIKKEVLEISE